MNRNYYKQNIYSNDKQILPKLKKNKTKKLFNIKKTSEQKPNNPKA